MRQSGIKFELAEWPPDAGACWYVSLQPLEHRTAEVGKRLVSGGGRSAAAVIGPPYPPAGKSPSPLPSPPPGGEGETGVAAREHRDRQAPPELSGAGPLPRRWPSARQGSLGFLPLIA